MNEDLIKLEKLILACPITLEEAKEVLYQRNNRNPKIEEIMDCRADLMIGQAEVLMEKLNNRSK